MGSGAIAGKTPTFVPGNPGNSGGKKGRSGRRPYKLGEKCREAFEKHGLIHKIVDIAKNAKRDCDKIAAIKFLAERGWGQPTQEVQITEVPHEIRVFRENAPA